MKILATAALAALMLTAPAIAQDTTQTVPGPADPEIRYRALQEQFELNKHQLGMTETAKKAVEMSLADTAKELAATNAMLACVDKVSALRAACEFRVTQEHTGTVAAKAAADRVLLALGRGSSRPQFVPMYEPEPMPSMMPPAHRHIAPVEMQRPASRPAPMTRPRVASAKQKPAPQAACSFF